MRGSRRRRRGRKHVVGSIPACAGKPSSCAPNPHTPGVHPRVCGEAMVGSPRSAAMPGPSPRVRGSPLCPQVTLCPWGSIPACAGKPPRRSRSASRPRVHPRVCGEAPCAPRRTRHAAGPSPRVRGSRRDARRRDPHRGSIPACAGKPDAPIWPRIPIRVHPRVCGEAGLMWFWATLSAGPSPRVRGSLDLKVDTLIPGGSIPACAGKPLYIVPTATNAEVHPRVCGEAREDGRGVDLIGGPSPRVRGSPRPPWPRSAWRGSIPACAGKPE